jgi:hypothetical protein
MNWILVYSTNNILEISYLKHFLLENEIPFSFQDEGFLSLSYEAIPIHEAIAKLYVLENHFEEVNQFIMEKLK